MILVLQRFGLARRLGLHLPGILLRDRTSSKESLGGRVRRSFLEPTPLQRSEPAPRQYLLRDIKKGRQADPHADLLVVRQHLLR